MSPFDHSERLARLLLFEGYVLFPYHAAALKNRARCSFGELVPRGPRSYGRDEASGEVLATLAPGARIEVRVAFLQTIVRPSAEGPAWEAAREHALSSGPLACEELIAIGERTIRFDASSEPSEGESRNVIAELRLQIAKAVLAPPGTFRLRFTIANLTDPGSGDDRALRSLHAAHLAAHVTGGAFVSAIEPEPALAEATAALEPDGLWPILVGPPGDDGSILLSPIILYDRPQIAPESPGDLFDATENDELLTLSILALGDEERALARATDPRARAILDRCDALGAGLGRLHGAVRTLTAGGSGGTRVRVGAKMVGAGDSVRLRTRRGDVFDQALFGRRATVVSVDVEVSGREHLVVVVDGDPGADLGELGQGVGHRFYVAPDEVEALAAAEGASP